jgi:hypothetical protein
MDNDKLKQEFEEWFLSATGSDKSVLGKQFSRYISDAITGMFMAYVAGYEKAKLNEEK